MEGKIDGRRWLGGKEEGEEKGVKAGRKRRKWRDARRRERRCI